MLKTVASSQIPFLLLQLPHVFNKGLLMRLRWPVD